MSALGVIAIALSLIDFASPNTWLVNHNKSHRKREAVSRVLAFNLNKYSNVSTGARKRRGGGCGRYDKNANSQPLC